MTSAAGAAEVEQNPLLEFLGSPRFSAALSTASIGAVFLSYLIRSLIGWQGLGAILTLLVGLAILSLVGQRHALEWRGFLPISLAVFVGWSCVSLFFSQFHWATFGGLAYQLAVGALGLYIALARDLIQIVRSFGDVLRLVIGLSLGLEFIVGGLLDTRFVYLGIQGDIAVGGPIQGVMGTRNALGLVALLAIVTFGTELFTRSLGRVWGIGSLAFAVLTLVLSQSPIELGIFGILGITSVGLLALRRVRPANKVIWLIALIVVVFAAIVVAYVTRDTLLRLVGAAGVLDYRVSLWNQLFPFIQIHGLTGWGWVGIWPTDLMPFRDIAGGGHGSALNAYFDLWFQLGLVGLFSFLVFAALAIIRAWILATSKRSRSFVWPALVLVALLGTSVFESGILVEWGWLVMVTCAVKVAQHVSWRRPLADAKPASDLK